MACKKLLFVTKIFFLAQEKFTLPQKANIVLWYGICGDPKVIQNKYLAVYGKDDGDINIPTEEQIMTWYKNFRYTGFIETQDAEEHVEEEIEKELKLSKVSNLLHKIDVWVHNGPRIRTFHPYHMKLLHFGVEDLDERLKFANVRFNHWLSLLRVNK